MYADDGIYDRTQMYMERKVRTTEAKYWTTEECATEWRTTSRNVAEWCRKNLIPRERVGGQWRIPRDAQPPVFEGKGLPPIKSSWWDVLPNRAECVLGVRAYIHQVEAATGMGALDNRLSYGPAEGMIIDSIAAHDVEVASAMEGYTESKEAERNMATSNGRLTIRRADDDWNWHVQGIDRTEVQAKANQLIEAFRPYSTL